MTERSGVRPRISSADTRQTVDKATGDDSHARISASGDHSTDEKAIHSLGTIIQVRLHGFQIVRESGPGTGYDGSCERTSPKLKQASRARGASFGCASWHKANLEAAQRTMSQVSRDEMACAKRTFGTFPH